MSGQDWGRDMLCVGLVILSTLNAFFGDMPQAIWLAVLALVVKR